MNLNPPSLNIDNLPDGFRFFHNGAPNQYALLPSPRDKKLCCVVMRRFDYIPKVEDFLRRWKPEIVAAAELHPAASPQLLAAFSIASDSHANTSHKKYHPNMPAELPQSFPSQHLDGLRRELWVKAGLFDTALPLARLIAKKPDLKAEDLFKPKFAFDIFAKSVLLAYTEFFTRFSREPDPVQLAVAIHAGGFRYSSANDFRINYRGKFLDNFIGAFNAAYIHVQPENQETK